MRASPVFALMMVIGSAPVRAQEFGCRSDGRLLPAARAVLGDARVSAETLRALTEAASLRAPDVLSWRAEGGDPELRLAQLRAWVASRSLASESPRCAVVSTGGSMAMALVPRAAEVIALPAEPGHRAWLVALPSAAENPVLLAAPDHGPVVRHPINAEGIAGLRIEGAATMQVVLVRAGEPQVWARWREGTPRAESVVPMSSAADVLHAVNAMRVHEGRTVLRGDPLLVRAAEGYAVTLAQARRVAHTVDGDPSGRLARMGIRADVVGEVIARAPTLVGAFDALHASPSHREVLLDTRIDAMGTAIAVAEGQRYLVVMVAARPAIAAPPP